MPFERRFKASLSMVFGNREVCRRRSSRLTKRNSIDATPSRGASGHSRRARSILFSQLAPPRRSLWADAAKVRCPVLLIYGGKDRLVDARIRTKAHSAFPDARLLYLPESGHVAQMEHPQEVEQAFRQLISNRAAILGND